MGPTIVEIRKNGGALEAKDVALRKPHMSCPLPRRFTWKASGLQFEAALDQLWATLG